MVNIEDIIKVFNYSIDNYDVKCSNREIKSKLSNMSDEEKMDALEGKLTLAEKDYYTHLVEERKNIMGYIRDHKKRREEYEKQGYKEEVEFCDSLINEWESEVKDFEDAIFNYEKRIVRGHEIKEGAKKEYDLNKYTEDNQFYDDDTDAEPRYGKLETKLINKQKNIGLDNNQVECLSDYFYSSRDLNSMLWGGDSWNNLSKDEKESKMERLNQLDKGLSEAINSCPPTTEPMIVYHSGNFDVSKLVGDHLKFKGYTSASFQKSGATDMNTTFNGIDVNYTYRILLPTGSKGVCANDSNHRMTNYWTEHEYLLDKGLEGDIVDIDVENHMVTIQV